MREQHAEDTTQQRLSLKKRLTLYFHCPSQPLPLPALCWHKLISMTPNFHAFGGHTILISNPQLLSFLDENTWQTTCCLYHMSPFNAGEETLTSLLTGGPTCTDQHLLNTREGPCWFEHLSMGRSYLPLGPGFNHPKLFSLFQHVPVVKWTSGIPREEKRIWGQVEFLAKNRKNTFS